MSDLMSVRLHLKGVRVLEVVVDTVDRLVVGVELGRGRGVRTVGSSVPRCGTVALSGSVTWR